MVAVRKTFEVMGKLALGEKGNLMLNVLDHAHAKCGGDIDGVVGLPEWRSGTKLVPMEWLADS